MLTPIVAQGFILIVSLFVLVTSARFFSNSAVKVGKRFGFSSFMIGVVLVSVGTSLPELANALLSVFRGGSEIGVGNVVGSNISNILLVLGLISIFSRKGITIEKNLLRFDLFFFVLSSFFLIVTFQDGKFIFYEGIIGILIYIFYIYSSKNKNSVVVTERKFSTKKDYLKLLLFVVLIYLSAKFVIDSVLNLSSLLDINTEVLAVSVVAIGTTLPEIVTSLVNILKRRSRMAFGTIVGSVIFNSFIVTGIPSLFGNLNVPDDLRLTGLPFLMAATLIHVFIVYKRRVTVFEGFTLLLLYGFFIYALFANGG